MQDVLGKIVVRIFEKEGRAGSLGTGFYISGDLVATCYHVLSNESGLLNEQYYIKHDLWKSPKLAHPIKEKCSSEKDTAILSSEPNPQIDKVPLIRWDKVVPLDFLSPGYDHNTGAEVGATTIEGRILGSSSLKGWPRIQLQVVRGTLIRGRSGSPVWSKNGIIGMIDYQVGEENILNDTSLAIPVEALGIEVPPPIKVINVPPLPDKFIPRNQYLEKAKKALLSPDDRSTAITGVFRKVGIDGMGGIGKSVLASALARDDQVQEAFPDGVIWVTIGRNQNLIKNQLQHIIRSLGESQAIISDIEDGRLYLNQLLQDKSCLVILDDVWKMEDLYAFNTLGPRCKMLITTRNRSIVRDSGAIECEISELSDNESLELLSLWSGQSVETLPPEARKVAEECGDLPLALAMVGAMAKNRPDRWGVILHRLQSADLDKIKTEFPDYHNCPDLMRAIGVSIEALETEEQRCYLELAVFPEGIGIPEKALQVLWDMDEDDTIEMVYLLVDRSLARLMDSILSIHDLQHDFVVKRSGDLKELHNQFLNKYERLCPEGWPSGPNDGYFFQHLAYHLIQAGREEDLKRLLFDFEWICAKLSEVGLASLISDYDYLSADEGIRLVQSAIKLSSHALSSDPGQLQAQLLGRLMWNKSEQIQTLIEQILRSCHNPWLRPLTPSLILPGGPLAQMLKGHVSPIQEVMAVPDSERIISRSSDGILKVWDLGTGTEFKTFSSIGQILAVTPNGKCVVSGSRDNAILIWELDTGREIKTLEGHTSSVDAVAVTRDGERAVSASSDGIIKVWNLKTGKEIRTISGSPGWIKELTVTPDGRKAISIYNFSGMIKVWDLDTGDEIKILEGHTGSITGIALIPDGKGAIVKSNHSIIGVWNLDTKNEIKALDEDIDSIGIMAITPDGRKAVSRSGDRIIRVWDLETGKQVGTLEGHTSWITALAITSDGRRAISVSNDNDNLLRVWELDAISEKIETVKDSKGLIIALSVTSYGRTVISGSADNTFKIWDLETGNELGAHKVNTSSITAVSVTPEGKMALSGSIDGKLNLWNLKTGEAIKTINGHTDLVIAVAIAPDGQKAVSGSWDKKFKFWNLESEDEIYGGHDLPISALAITPDGRCVISGSEDTFLKVWDLGTGEEIKTLKGHNAPIEAVVVTSNGKEALSGSSDNTLKLWDLKMGREIKTFEGHIRSVRSLAATPDGKIAVSGSYDNMLMVWNLETGKAIMKFISDGPITAVAITPDALNIIAGESSGRIHFLRWENKRQDVEGASQ